jgi:hypothetical protein
MLEWNVANEPLLGIAARMRLARRVRIVSSGASRAAIVSALALAAAIGLACNAIIGVNDLERVDCLPCPEDGSVDATEAAATDAIAPPVDAADVHAPGDGGTDAPPDVVDLGIHCATTVCTPGTETCCIARGSARCIIAGTGCDAGIDLACDDTFDCQQTPGTICCYEASRARARCVTQSACTLLAGSLLCDPLTSDPCNDAGTCSPSAALPTYFECQ